ncbi:MAG: tripartite tricarboxylate transporter permease [Deltaproteobacteria bacterium]|nr:tripartite tricarboxylate transporter permease [Deltaproteobacteria bacterium]
METLSHLMTGFGVALQPMSLLMMTLGLLLGLAVGVLPGLGGTAGVALLLPLTVLVAPEVAIIFLAAIYWGALFGGVITSVLFAIPGEPWSVALIFDGYPLTKQGKSGLALATAFLASFVGIIIASIFFVAAALPLALLALRFGPPEMFVIMMLAFSTFVGLGTGKPSKTLVSTAFGLLLTAVGLDIVTGKPRLAFGSITWLSGFHFVPITIGMFGLGEILIDGEDRFSTVIREKVIAKVGMADIKQGMREIWKFFPQTIAASIMGFFVGVLPGTGATPASFLGYGLAKQYSKDPDKYGMGAIEGVIAPQAAANAAGTGSLLPMITLGIPGSPTAAVLLAGLYMWGLWPGPRLFLEQPVFVWGLIASLFLAGTVCLIICLIGTPMLASIMRVPWGILTPIIIVACFVGSYVMRNLMFDVWCTLIFGVLGYIMKKLKYPLAPLAVALVLGDMTERFLRQSLILSDGSFSIFFTRPIAGACAVFAIFLFLLPVYKIIKEKRKARVSIGPG